MGAKTSKLKFLDPKDVTIAMVDAVEDLAVVAEMIVAEVEDLEEVDLVVAAEMIVVVLAAETEEAVDMEAVDEEMIEVMMIAVEVIAIVPEIATGDTVVGMTN